jgi:hypothetical protein
MAEFSGNEILDGWIDEYLYENSYQRLNGNPTFEGEDEPLPEIYPLSDMRDPEKAEQMCSVISQDFARYIQNHMEESPIPVDVQIKYSPHDTSFRPEHWGYEDRSVEGNPSHTVVQVSFGPDETYMVDFTAAQYGYSEFPMVQKLDGESWQRNWPEATEVEKEWGPTSERENRKPNRLDPFEDPPLFWESSLREAGKSQKALRQQAERHDSQHPDTSEVVHKFPDGWSIRRPRTNADHWRESDLMSNCVGDRCETSDDPNDPNLEPDSSYHSLRDPDNIPHVSWDLESPEPALGRHNSEIKERYRPYLEQHGIEYADTTCPNCGNAHSSKTECPFCNLRGTIGEPVPIG